MKYYLLLASAVILILSLKIRTYAEGPKEVTYINGTSEGAFSENSETFLEWNVPEDLDSVTIIDQIFFENIFSGSEYVNFYLIPIMQDNSYEPGTLDYWEWKEIYSSYPELCHFKATVNGEQFICNDADTIWPLKICTLYPGESKQISLVLSADELLLTDPALISDIIGWQIIAFELNEHPHISLELIEDSTSENGISYQSGETAYVKYRFVNDGNESFRRLIFTTKLTQAKQKGKYSTGTTVATTSYNFVLQPGKTTEGGENIPITPEDAEKGQVILEVHYDAYSQNPDYDKPFSGSDRIIIRTGNTHEETIVLNDMSSALLDDDQIEDEIPDHDINAFDNVKFPVALTIVLAVGLMVFVLFFFVIRKTWKR